MTEGTRAPETSTRARKDSRSRAYREFHGYRERPGTDRALAAAAERTELRWSGDLVPDFALPLVDRRTLDVLLRRHARKGFYAYAIVPATPVLREGWHARHVELWQSFRTYSGLLVISVVPPEFHAQIAAIWAGATGYEELARLIAALDEAAGNVEPRRGTR